jgi:hypothetical protein
MPGLVPGIHVLLYWSTKTCMAGISRLASSIFFVRTLSAKRIDARVKLGPDDRCKLLT